MGFFRLVTTNTTENDDNMTTKQRLFQIDGNLSLSFRTIAGGQLWWKRDIDGTHNLAHGGHMIYKTLH